MFKKVFSLLFFIILIFGFYIFFYYKNNHIQAIFNDFSYDKLHDLYENFYNDDAPVFFDDETLDPLRRNILIKNIKKDNVDVIEIEVFAENADKINYSIQNNEISEKVKDIEIPIKYLVADKISNINIVISLKNNKKIYLTKNINIKIRNNPKIPFSDSLPIIKVNKSIPTYDNYLYYCFMAIVYKDINELFLPMYIDSKGNIRSLFLREDIIPKEISDFLEKIEYSKTKFTYIDDDKIAFIGSLKEHFYSDIILIFNSNSKKIEKIIDLKDILDQNRFILNPKEDKEDKKDWLHPNSIFYDEKDKSLVISSRYQGIIKIDLHGNLKWILSPHKSWSKKYNKYLLQAVNLKEEILSKKIQEGEENYITDDYTFEWCWGQHFANTIRNGDIIVFDNGYCRNFIHKSDNEKYSRAVIYRINEKAKTIKQIWQYGKELNKNFFSIAKSSVIPVPKEDECIICSGLIINSNKNESNGKIIRINFKTNDIIFDIDMLYQNKYFDTTRKDSYLDEIIYTLLVNPKK